MALTVKTVQRALKQGLLLPLRSSFFLSFFLSYVNCFPLDGLLFTNEDGSKILESIYQII